MQVKRSVLRERRQGKDTGGVPVGVGSFRWRGQERPFDEAAAGGDLKEVRG